MRTRARGSTAQGIVQIAWKTGSVGDTTTRPLLEEILANEENIGGPRRPAEKVKILSNCDQTANAVFVKFKWTNAVCCKLAGWNY